MTQGCSANVADSEQMAGLLKNAKFEIVNELEPADVVIVNSCTVKTPSESALFKFIEDTKRQYPYKLFVITGCVAQTDRERLQEYSLVGTKQIHNIVEAVEETLNDNTVKMLETGEMPPLNLPKVEKLKDLRKDNLLKKYNIVASIKDFSKDLCDSLIIELLSRSLVKGLNLNFL